MNDTNAFAPDPTAVRVALWRALHLEVDQAPHVLIDKIGLEIAAPGDDWRDRPDMHPERTKGYRASIVGRARFVEDLVEEEICKGVAQCASLGAGLDTFALRRTDLLATIRAFEIDKAATQGWKRRRIAALGVDAPARLAYVPVDFEAGESWIERAADAGFERDRPVVATSTGVSLYLSEKANYDCLREIAGLAPGSTFAMTFMLPTDLVPPQERANYEMVQDRARAAGTPFLSFYRPSAMLALARDAGFKAARHASGEEIHRRYFAGRADGLRPARGEEFLIATT